MSGLCRGVLERACEELRGLAGDDLGVVDVRCPPSLDYAVQLAKLLSKLSPLISNLIDLSVIEQLNDLDWKGLGVWQRQDPGFPDALFRSRLVVPNPGIEIKAWSPLASEITARFRESATLFERASVNVALLAWLPSRVIYGRPRITNVAIVSAKSIASCRDSHYHRPPYYLLCEPEDTANRTGNLKQTNVNGYKLQGDQCDVRQAEALTASWGVSFQKYSSAPAYQAKIRLLMGRFPYRLDTNFAKLDRIRHPDVERFKRLALSYCLCGRTVADWRALLGSAGEADIKRNLGPLLAER